MHLPCSACYDGWLSKGTNKTNHSRSTVFLRESPRQVNLQCLGLSLRLPKCGGHDLRTHNHRIVVVVISYLDHNEEESNSGVGHAKAAALEANALSAIGTAEPLVVKA